MKTVFRSSEIAHVWWHEQAPMGRTSGSMSFEESRFISFRTCIAEWVKPALHPDVKLCLIVDWHYSRSC